MPRRSINNSDESPVPRRTSARIAAVQAASPVKTPAKSPRRKRKSVDTKSTGDDTESQPSLLKSESSVEELNGIETSPSTKDHESVSDSQEVPPKKAKVDEEITDETKVSEDIPETCHVQAEPIPVEEKPDDFEVVDKADVPASDSAEVEAAVAIQGDDQVLEGFVQVDKEELPPVSTVEAQESAVSKDVAIESVEAAADEAPSDSFTESASTAMNGDSHAPCPEEPVVAEEPSSHELPGKLCSTEEVPVQPITTPAAGDGAVNMVSIEPISQ